MKKQQRQRKVPQIAIHYQLKPLPRKPEWRRLKALSEYEERAREAGYKYIAGVDEAGRGPLAGPVVAAACLIPEDLFIIGIDDSKKLTPAMREEIFEQIVNDSRIVYGIGLVDVEEIDRINIYQASIQAMLKALAVMPQQPDYILVDGVKLPHGTIPTEKIIGGDALSQVIAAASVLAKVTRDRIMCDYHHQWPQYGFEKHKGYGTPQHLQALAEHGPCPLHRLSFEPVKNHHLLVKT